MATTKRPRLHILNGDSTANLLKEARLEGEVLAWREALIAGATPAGVDKESWFGLRARHLALAYDRGFDEVLNGLMEQEAVLHRLDDHDEVVLWFEHDLFCQIHLIYLLDRLSRRDSGVTRLSLICIDRFPGRQDFRGLGELSPAEIGSLLDKRHEISTEEKELGAQAWAAYCSPTPQKIEDLLNRNTASLPFLEQAMKKHMARFPSAINGLGLIENTALALISRGSKDFASLFGAFAKAEPLYGYGDLQLLNDLRRVADAKTPLVRIDRADGTGDSASAIPKLQFELTDLGATVLAGEADFVAENEVDFWLGGIQLTNHDHWRWNGEDMIHCVS
ncbi:MAG: hypothetical protein QOJ64_2484 [Acidobacteriota bacterium]|jgi:hypothetical protein|nr:hypothetical protein [Acidobacteriota bacterium]